jgi:hypothetical protein
MLASLLLACATVNVAKVPTQDLWLDDGQEFVERGAVQLALVGDMRPAMSADAAKSRVPTPDTAGRVALDISEAVQRGDVDAVVLLGDMVPFSTTRNWQGFTRTWSPLLAGSEPPEPGRMRVRTLPVAGNHDRYGDKNLVGFGAAFPGVGQDIGYGRVASWWYTDIVTRGTRWRLLALDSDKDAMGTRWQEQEKWLLEALKGDYDQLVVLMHHPRWTLASHQVADEHDAPSELLATIEDVTEIGQLVAVFAGHAHTNEVYLPGGPLGELYVVAGGGGSPADSLPRWGVADGADLKLEPIFDKAVGKAFERWSETRKVSQELQDKATGAGAWAGYTATYDARAMPIQGWWRMELDGKELGLTFRMMEPDGALKDVYAAQHDPREGWKIGK